MYQGKNEPISEITPEYNIPEQINVSFSIAKKNRGILTKILTLNKETGEVVKDGSQCRMSAGTLTTYSIDSFERFKNALIILGGKHNKCLVHGVPKDNYPKTVNLISKAKYTGKQKNTITRSKDHICYPEGNGLMMFDHDKARANSVSLNDKALEVFKTDQLIKVLSDIHPALEKAAYVSSVSTSACIFDKTGKELRGEGSGAHIYIFPKQAADIPRYLKTLGERLIIAGYGRIEVSRSGALNIRTIIDLAVGSPERLDFIAGAECKNGLKQNRPEPVLREGQLLNTLSLLDLTEDEKQQYSKAVEALKKKAKTRSEEVKGIYIKDEAAKLIKKNPLITTETAQKTILSRQNHVLQDDDLLYFARDRRESVTVSECLAQPKKYDKKSLADPLEPEYDGWNMTKAMFYFNAGHGMPCIHSYAHGNVKYLFKQVEDEKAEKQINELTKKDKPAGEEYYTAETLIKLNELNKEYGTCLIGNDFRIIKEDFDRVNKKHIIKLLKKSAFQNHFLNKKGFANTEQGLKRYPLTNLWLEWPLRRTYTSLVFEPDVKNLPKGAYNLFQGFPIKPKKGNWSLLRQHIEEIICSGNKDHAEYLLDWMARCVKDPGGDRPGVAVVMKGGKGCGKGVFANYFGQIFGEAFMPVSNSKGITGNFNFHLSKCLMVFLDEAIWSGDHKNEGQFKALITEPEIAFEPKGIDRMFLKNFINVLIASNEEWVCPATIDERRFFVLEPSSEMTGDTEYFNNIVKERNNGGVEALYYDLLHRKYDLQKLRLAPRTRGLMKQVEQNLDKVTAFWKFTFERDFLLSDEYGAPASSMMGGEEEAEWPTTVYKYEVYNEFEKHFCKKERFPVSNRVFWRKTGEVLDREFVSIRQKHAGKRFLLIKDLSGLKQSFYEKTGLEPDVDEDNADQKPAYELGLVPF